MVCLVFGISYLPLLIYEILFFISVVVHHSNIYITERIDKAYRILFASPLMHRIHHSTDWYETNSNFGALFSLWDRIFKSWKMEKNKQIEFGLPKKGM
jgi:sterol desaturase/sphingolipid hydroxylase (fatty acid hydroxylase superfamily)